MKIVELACLAGAAFLLATGVTGRPVDDPGAAIVPPTARVAAKSVEPGAVQPDGKAIFEGKGNCAACHGRDAKGTALAPDLTDDEWLNISGAVEEIATLVRKGVARPQRFPAPMPPMGGARLNDAEIEAVAQYVFALSAAPAE
jgi:cbb3-type cytochrome c oxidase subunit III